jgi:hypothetical protein
MQLLELFIPKRKGKEKIKIEKYCFCKPCDLNTLHTFKAGFLVCMRCGRGFRHRNFYIIKHKHIETEN